MNLKHLSVIAKYLLIAIAVVFIGIPVLIIGSLFVAKFFKGGDISTTEAAVQCRQFHDGVQAQLTAIPGYTIVKSAKDCTPTKDELGSTDYIQEANFVVTGGDTSSVPAVKNNLEKVAEKLTADKFSISVMNILASDTQPAAICVNASRYVDNNGEVYSQGVDGVKPVYIEPGTPGTMSSYEEC